MRRRGIIGDSPSLAQRCSGVEEERERKPWPRVVGEGKALHLSADSLMAAAAA